VEKLDHHASLDPETLQLLLLTLTFIKTRSSKRESK